MRSDFFKSTLSLCLTLAFAASPSVGQARKEGPPSSCQRDSALDLIRQQVDGSRLFDDMVKRIAVLIRAADLLWPNQENRARTVFNEAYDLAQQNYKEKGDKPRNEGNLIVQVPDQRYRVISAIARRDAAWARKLSDQMLQDELKEAEEKTTKDAEQDVRTGEKLLSTAYSLLSSDQSAALNFAKSSLHYPPTMWLPMFLYKLAEVNRTSADGIYQEALTAYAGAPLERFLYLSSYPFGNDHDVGEMPMWTSYAVPKNFAPSPILQRLFVQTLLRRAQQIIESPGEVSAEDRFSDAHQIWFAFTRLEPQVESALPDLIEPLRQAKGNVFALLSQKDQQRVTNRVIEPPKKSFDELVEEADRQPNPQIREGSLAMALLFGGNSETIERLSDVAAKIDDPALRDKLLNWLYFDRAQQAIKDQKLDVAKKLASKVAELDQRAYLYLKIAEESIKSTKNDADARELLEEVVTAAAKAPDTEVKGRALLGVAYLYTRVDANRTIAVLSDAVKSINHIESPDFSNEDAGRRIEGRGFGAYATMNTPGFSPENGFREIAKYDFDGALYLAGNFRDKALRAMTTLALVDLCLQKTRERTKAEKARKKTKL